MVRRLIIAALAALAALIPMAPTPAHATTPHYLIIGASITRLAGDELRQAYGSSLDLQAVDGRAFTIGDINHGPSIWGVFLAKYPALKAGDWLIIEMSHGGVDVETNRRYLTAVVARLDNSVCLGVIVPHTYYDTLDSVAPGQGWPMAEWNADMKEMQAEVIAAQPCHRLVDWDFFVNRSATGPLGEPVLYDGRHPTTPYGVHLYASAIWWACK